MKRVYNTQKKKVFLAILTIITILYMTVYLLWRLVYTIPSYSIYGWVATILGVALLVSETLSMLEAITHSKDTLFAMEPEFPTIPLDWYPEVDVFIATHNEEEDLLYKTINGCCFMKYPDLKKVHIYVCDDGNRPSIKQLAKKMGVGYFGMEDNKLAKAGNLNNALVQTNSPLVVTFDADMIPSSSFLMETVPYFFLPKMKKDEEGNWIPKEEEEIDENDKIGFIQLPQSFYNPDLFQYNLFMEDSVPNEQDYFFRQVNIGRNQSNSAIYAGSNTVISREALELVGGIKTGTITEDFETGIAIEMAGYKCYAVNKLLAKGLAPNTITSLIKQRERWGRGCVYSLRRIHLILNPKIPFKMKISYMACRSYWDSFLRRFIYILSPIISALCGIPMVICGMKELLLIWLPAYALYGITLRLNSGNVRSSRLSNIIDTIMFPYLMVPILMEFFNIHKEEFHVTEKSKRENIEEERILAVPHFILFVLSLLGLFKEVGDLLIYQTYGNIIIIYWLCVNGIALLMAVFFMLGRKNQRNYERFLCDDMDIVITCKDRELKGRSADISEGGFCVQLSHMEYLPNKNEDDEDEIYKVTLSNDKYKAEVAAKIVAVKKEKQGWKYSFEVVDIADEDLKQYMQLIFDREHTLPKTISITSSTYGDVLTNITGRINKKTFSGRKLARISVGKEYNLQEGGTAFLVNFNYEYAAFDAMEQRPELHVMLTDKICMHCKKTSQTLNIYKILNIEELLALKEFNDIVMEWEKSNEKKK